MKPKIFRPSLRSRIIAWSFIPTTLILFAIALTIFYAYQRVTEDLVVGRNEELTRRAAGQLASDLGSYADTLTALARSGDISSDDPVRQSTALMQAANRLVVFDGGLVILNHLGQVVATAPERREWLGQDWSSRGFFQQMMHTTGPTYSDILPGDSAAIGVAVPILGAQGELRGTLVGMFQLGVRSVSALYGGIVKLRIGDNTYLVDSTGRIIYHSNDELIGADLQALPMVQQVLKNQTGYLRTRDVQGRDILASYAPVPGTPWGLISEEQWSGLLTTSQGYGQFLLLLLALGVIVPTLVVTIGVKRIIDPIARLIVAAKEIAGGNFGQQINVHTGDELEELVKQFNLMSKELSESYAQLEQRVAARTKELATLIAIAGVVSRSLDLKEILNAALNKAMETMRMEIGTAYGIQDGVGPVEEQFIGLTAPRILSAYSSQQDAGLLRARTLPIQTAAEGQQPTVWLVAHFPDPQVKQALEMEGVRQIIHVPLVAKGKLVGRFNLGTRHERQITPEEMSLLASIGQQIAVAVENGILYNQAEQSAAIAERQRLSRELHDSVTQSLYSVTLYAEAAARLLATGNTATAVEHLRELRDTAQEALREMRLLIFELRPLALEKIGLAAALQARLDSVEVRGGLQTELHVAGVQYPEQLPRSIEEELYHIAQEALNNVLKHSHAQHVRVHLRFSDNETLLEICDDGIGFAPTAAGDGGGLGLASLKERAEKIGGRLEIESTPGHGTEIRVVVPVSSTKDRDAGAPRETAGAPVPAHI